MLAFGGERFDKPEGEPDQLRLFKLYSDPRQGIAIPFAAAAFAPDSTSQASVSPLYLLESGLGPNNGLSPGNDYAEIQVEGPPPAPSPSVWVQTSYLVLGEGEDQQSILVLALGTQDENQRLTGVRRGTAAFPIDEIGYTEIVSLTGNISTLDNPESDPLMGNTVPHLIIGADSTGSGHKIFEDSSMFRGDGSADLGATYHVGEQILSKDASTLTQTAGDYYGYASGMYQMISGSEASVDGLMNATPDQVHLKFKDDNRLSALFQLEGVNNGGGADLAFGDWGNSTGHSAFISDKVFAATEGSVKSTVSFAEYVHPKTIDTKAYLVSSGLLNPNFSLCKNCDFMRWGAWGGEGSFNNAGDPAEAAVNLGWFVAGDVITDAVSELPVTGSAIYTGNAIGNVASFQNNAWKNYVATGKTDMSWNFADRAGRFDITGFDKSPANTTGRSFGGPIEMPESPTGVANRFTGGIVGGGLSGNVAGSFVRSPGQGPGSIPNGAIGNWNAGNEAYRVNGVFGVRR